MKKHCSLLITVFLLTVFANTTVAQVEYNQFRDFKLLTFIDEYKLKYKISMEFDVQSIAGSDSYYALYKLDEKIQIGDHTGTLTFHVVSGKIISIIIGFSTHDFGDNPWNVFKQVTIEKYGIPTSIIDDKPHNEQRSSKYPEILKWKGDTSSLTLLNTHDNSTRGYTLSYSLSDLYLKGYYKEGKSEYLKKAKKGF